MENNILINNIKKLIKTTVTPCYENTSGTELYVRCPHCGDSKKSKSSAHFYIQMRPPFKFYCQKCGFSGVLNQDILEQLQIFNSNIIDNINELNKNIKKPDYNKTNIKKQQKFNYQETLTEQAKTSLEYFNKRFNVNETLESIKKFNLICDPIQFFNYLYNKHNITLDFNPKFDYYSSLGFLSYDRKYLINRDNSGLQKIRYTNTSLSDDENKSKIYTIKTKINALSPKITLVITEGIFDAIGLYYKDYCDKENVIISAACGKSFEKVILTFIKMGIINLDIKIYSDSDVDISFFKKMKKNNKIISLYPIDVYYNTLDKDFGLSKDKILLRKITI